MLSSVEDWNEKQIKNRAKSLSERGLKVWPYPHTEYLPESRTENTYSLFEDINFTGEKISSFIFLADSYSAKSWKSFYHQVALILYDLDPHGFKTLLTDEDFRTKNRMLISENKKDVRSAIKISENLYLESNLSTEHLLERIRVFVRKFGLTEDDISFSLIQDVT